MAKAPQSSGAFPFGEKHVYQIGPGLTKPEKAEIQIIARHHGLLILGPLPEDGMVEELIGEVNGGCPPRMCVSLRDNVHPAP